MRKRKNLNPTVWNIVQKYLRRLQEQGISVEKAILFGSQARGDATEDSDIDLLVVVKQADAKIRDVIIDEAYNISLEEGMALIALPCERGEFDSPLFQSDAFYRNLKNEGVFIV